ncbi:helix-turn-helix domain-containing protein [Streptomyces roseoverticillatus]|uniref:helix-turn-helix domain-containing protein n=1 Tax=Streptomyces roseoverticillatus TaxID=66429 RepID=UPI0004BF6560|nr:helix-turn-helix domain-containing protein [Streptomyces roseoverticillatus]
MIRIRFSAADFARVRFAPRPVPLQALNTAFMMLFRGDDHLLFGRWRQRLLRNLPAAVEPLGDLVTAAGAPLFLDEFGEESGDAPEHGLDAVRAAPPGLVRTELERVYAGHPAPPPPWVRDLHRGDAGAWQVLRRAQHAAFETAVRPVWPLVQDLHRAEFTRHALAVAEHGVGAALAALVPGGRLRGDVWELPAPGERDLALRGRGVLLLPAFQWTGHPLVADLPGRPLVLSYAAGPGLPLSPKGAGGREGSLAEVLGRTRVDVLAVLAQEHTTSGLARRLGVSNATASAHAAALRGAGLVTSARAGRAVLHRRTDLGSLLLRGREHG